MNRVIWLILAISLVLGGCSFNPKVTAHKPTFEDGTVMEDVTVLVSDTRVNEEGGPIVKEIVYVMHDEEGKIKGMEKGAHGSGYGTVQTILPSALKAAASIVSTKIAADGGPAVTHDGDSSTVFQLQGGNASGGNAGALANQATGVGVGVGVQHGSPCGDCQMQTME